MTTLAESRYRDLVELSLDGIVLQTDGQIAFSNRAAQRIAGAKDADELLGRRIDDLLDPPYLSVVRDELMEPGSRRTPFVERRLKRLDGTLIDVEVSAVPFVYENRPSVQLVLRDIRERVRAREAMLWAESQFRVLAEQMPFVMWTSDPTGRVLSVIGDASAPLAGQALAAMQAGQVLPLGPQAPAIPLSESLLANGHRTTFELAVGGRSYAVRLEPHRSADAIVDGWLGVALDVTPWVRAQELLREALRVDAIGQLAGGVAHEINNVLSIIVGQGELLEKHSPEDSGSAALAHQILAATRRAADITRNLLTFAMRDTHRPVRVSLNDVARDVYETIGHTIPASVTVQLRLAPRLPKVFGDATALSRALMNICLNAIDAMPAGGQITLETAEIPPASGSEAARVRISVTDTGVGMSAERRERAFEPFFTAWPRGKHVGLGLSMVQGVVRQHLGEVHLRSQPFAGTTVTIDLPVAGAASLVTLGSPERLTDTSGRSKALIVDDEPVLRHLAGKLLEKLGYSCVAAEDGAAAVARFRESPADYAFVLLDVVMPGMSGIEALRHLRAIDPDVRVILCSGYPRAELDPAVFASGRVEYLPKPYWRDALETLVAQVTRRAPTL